MGEELFTLRENRGMEYGVGGGERDLKLSGYLGCGFDRLKKRSEERRLEIPVSNLVGVHLRKS
jgi:hypothetical protein